MTLLFIALALLVSASAYLLTKKPTHEGPWQLEQGRLPYCTQNGSKITIHNVRAFVRESEKDIRPHYEDRTYDITEIKSLDYIIDDFGQGFNAAHTFVSFGFTDGRYISFSVEARRRPNEEYSAILGALRKFMLMYIAVDERDILKLRAVYWNHRVHLYPIKATKEQIQSLFKSVTCRINALYAKPEFYNTITNACASNLLHHANEVSKKRIRLNLSVIAPGSSDKTLYKAGVIDTTLSFEEARRHFLVSDAAQKLKDDPDFSVRLRETLQTK